MLTVRLRIGYDHKPTFSGKGNCVESSASFCIKPTTYGTMVTNGITTTTMTQTGSVTCPATITGCGVLDQTQTKEVTACTLQPDQAMPSLKPRVQPPDQAWAADPLFQLCAPKKVKYIIYPGEFILDSDFIRLF